MPGRATAGLDRYAARRYENFVLVVSSDGWPHCGPRRATRAKRYWQPAEGLPGYQGQSPWLVSLSGALPASGPAWRNVATRIVATIWWSSHRSSRRWSWIPMPPRRARAAGRRPAARMEAGLECISPRRRTRGRTRNRGIPFVATPAGWLLRRSGLRATARVDAMPPGFLCLQRPERGTVQPGWRWRPRGGGWRARSCRDCDRDRQGSSHHGSGSRYR
jgi:hypothetical protein